MKSVTVVLNGYKRQHTLAKQIASLKSQSHPVARIMYFNFKSDDPRFIPDYAMLEKEGIEYAITSHHYGVWGRFTFALNATTDFVCIMDDDIIPGARFIENCVSSYEKCPGVYGTLGPVYDNKTNSLILYGWKDINNNEAVQVSYLYQCWFMPREVLNAFWSESVPEDITKNRRIGEDMTVSLMARKRLGLNCYVAPHPADDKALWGNTIGDEYGVDEFAIHLNQELLNGMMTFHTHAQTLGMELVQTTSLTEGLLQRVRRLFMSWLR